MLNPLDSERALLAPLHIRENLRWVLLVSSFCSVASCSENASSEELTFTSPPNPVLGKSIFPRIHSRVGSPAALLALSVTWASVF